MYQRLTAMPLMDLPRMPHPRVLQPRGGAGLPPPPFAALARWGAVELSSRFGSTGVARWAYVAAEWPEERLLHLVAVGAAPTSAARTTAIT